MKTTDFNYYLPEELIAQKPANPRDYSRLMVIDRKSGDIKHRRFYNLPEYLSPGDLLIFNDTRVMKARLYGIRIPSGSKIEILLLQRVEEGLWKVLVKPGRRMRTGDRFEIQKIDQSISGQIVKEFTDGSRLARLSDEHLLESLGEIPLPPYIKNSVDDPERYQTVYSKITGSIAAPTAGLHFTPNLIEYIKNIGVEIVFTTLHVGWDSFRPMKSEDIKSHNMHSEYWKIGKEAATAINKAKSSKQRIISVGTTTVRLLEYAALQKQQSNDAYISAGSGATDLFIYPGYEFKIVDGLITNFHLPQSTLLMLTSAFAGKDLVMYAYNLATKEKYNFYSFGDAMIII